MGWNDLTSISLLVVLAIVSIFIGSRLLLAPAPASFTPPAKRQKVSGAKNYRIRCVPLVWDKDDLQSFLAAHDGCHDPAVKSLAIEAHQRYQTGTVTFRDGTDPPKTLQGTLRPDEGNQTLILDDNFLGLTTLFTPPPEDHTIDIVAIAGLGGHAFGSFRELKGHHMWLRDALPYDLLWEHTNRPMARIITYGYASEIANSGSMQNLEDLATTFRESLTALTSSRRARPLIFVAHSLGGLIVKQALITLANSKADDHRKLLQAVYGVVFFGVPHDGMDIRSLIPMVADGPNRELVGSLNQTNSQILSIQQRDFHKALGPKGQTEVFCFYETQDSPTAKQNDDGTWGMTGDRTILVTKSSATHCRPWEDGPENICAINRSHRGMVKFGVEDHDYEWTVRGKLEGLAQRALTVQSRLRDENTNFLVPYNQNPDYVGRLEILDTIKETLGYGKSLDMRHSRLSLFGLGGVGKTQVALAFSYWVRENYSDVSVFWVHAASSDRFRQAFTAMAEELRIHGHDDSKADVPMLVRRWLERKERGRWIMVIDNADDKELFFPSDSGSSNTSKERSAPLSSRLGNYLPDCAHGSILITTRDKKAASRFCQGKPSIIEIDKMDPKETGQLLQRTLGKEASLEEAASLSARLEYLPLALVQAAAFIQENSISISEYLQLLDESDENLVNQLSEPFTTVGRDSNVPNEVTTTWIVSFNQIQQRDILASQILSFICLLDRQAIPKKFVIHYCNEKHNRLQQPGTIEITKALGTLKAFSFVTESKGSTIDMHRLVQLVTRKWLIMRDEHSKYAEYSMDVVSTLFPFGTHETREDCMNYLPHALSVLQNEGSCSSAENTARASLLVCVAGYFSYRSEFDKAERYELQSVSLRKQVLGEDDPSTLRSINNLAETYGDQGRWKEAEVLGVQALEARKRVLGEEHPDTIRSMANLAAIYSNQGRWKEAEKLEVQVMELRKRTRAEHPDTLRSIANLAATYSSQRRWKEAEELEVQALEARKRVLGEKHPDTIRSMANLAAIYSNQGRWKEAEELEIRALEARKRVFGQEHHQTLISIANLASTYYSQGRLKEARELGTQVMEIRRRVFGKDHPETLRSIANLAVTYGTQGQLKEAEELEVQVLEARKRVLGSEHPDTFVSMANLACTWRSQKRWKEAIYLMQDCVRGRERSLGSNHPLTIRYGSVLSDWKADLEAKGMESSE
ncbi:hypothetical protein LY78DRAFT_642439 [Colletotrichum sublineola]|uniref:Uncharacterized protein n=1 Tax=Colletotrichum sublineola TaxID=1173701 RepID=A0A066WTW7_COLSU|nr:hypothetical protein LY78DRAFT_642439 [Colletotrichum sublineola]KDN60333.1 hypothetical protein CSUB01_03498 [Colletotrichum sublineola]